MQALRINLLSSATTPSALGWLILGAGSIFCAVAWWDQTEARNERAAVQTRLAQKAPAPRPRVAAMRGPGEAEASKSQQRALDQLVLPWARWFGVLEGLPGERVALLALDMQGSAASVRLSAEARDIRQALAYLSALRASPAVASAVLSTHERVQVGEVEVLRFTIDLQWKRAP